MIPALGCSGNAELGRQERDQGAVRAEQAEPCRGGVVASHTRPDPQRARREPQGQRRAPGDHDESMQGPGLRRIQQVAGMLTVGRRLWGLEAQGKSALSPQLSVNLQLL